MLGWVVFVHRTAFCKRGINTNANGRQRQKEIRIVVLNRDYRLFTRSGHFRAISFVHAHASTARINARHSLREFLFRLYVRIFV